MCDLCNFQKNVQDCFETNRLDHLNTANHLGNIDKRLNELESQLCGAKKNFDELRRKESDEYARNLGRIYGLEERIKCLELQVKPVEAWTKEDRRYMDSSQQPDAVMTSEPSCCHCGEELSESDLQEGGCSLCGEQFGVTLCPSVNQIGVGGKRENEQCKYFQSSQDRQCEFYGVNCIGADRCHVFAYAPEPAQVKREPWKPKECERVFYITDIFTVLECEYWPDISFHVRRLEVGNCFQTKEQAESFLAQIKKLKEEME